MRKWILLLLLWRTSLPGAGPLKEYSEQQKRWAMALAAIPVSVNNGSHDRLGIFQSSQKNVDNELSVLKENYISSSVDLRQRIQLWRTGSYESRKFSTLAHLAPNSVSIWRDIHPPGSQERQRLDDALEQGSRFGDLNLSGWDYGRIAHLCRSGYLASLISEEEAWACLFDTANDVQSRFHSWQEFGGNYIAGRRFWDRQAPNSARYDWAYRNLLLLPESPWRTLPWNLDLSPGAVQQPKAVLIPPSTHLELASHPGGLTCFRMTVCDRPAAPSLIHAFSEAFGCELKTVSEHRSQRDYTVRGDCKSPFVHSDDITTTELQLNPVFDQLRAEGANELFLTWDHPPSPIAVMTPRSHHQWEVDGRTYESRTVFLGSTRQSPIKLVYGAHASIASQVTPWVWYGLLIAVAGSLLVAKRGTPVTKAT